MSTRPALAVAALIASTTLGCATGMPLGARSAMRGVGEPLRFTAGAAPRAIPAPVESDETLTAPSDAVAAKPKPPRSAPPRAPFVVAPVVKADRGLALKLARGLVGKAKIELNGHRYPDDCTGLVAGVYAQLGIALTGEAAPGDNGVTAIYRYAQKHGRVYPGGWPVAGDLVFFKETYDQNRDGRSNDGLTHVGLVDEVRGDGTIVVIHRVKRGVVRYRMNLKYPDLRVDPKTGEVLNDALRAAGTGRSTALTGQLFAAYATVLPTGVATAAVASR